MHVTRQGQISPATSAPPGAALRPPRCLPTPSPGKRRHASAMTVLSGTVSLGTGLSCLADHRAAGQAPLTPRTTRLGGRCLSQVRAGQVRTARCNRPRRCIAGSAGRARTGRTMTSHPAAAVVVVDVDHLVIGERLEAHRAGVVLLCQHPVEVIFRQAVPLEVVPPVPPGLGFRGEERPADPPRGLPRPVVCQGLCRPAFSQVERTTGTRGPRSWHPLAADCSVGRTGFEPVTSSVSGKRAPAAPTARDVR